MVFLQQLLNGILLGSIYALIALGYTMVYGIVRLINFAHGDIYMLGAFMGFFLARYYESSFIPALVGAMTFCAISGMIVEKLAYKPLRGAPRIAALTTAIGVSLFLQNLIRWRVGPNPLPFPDLFARISFQAGDLIITNVQITVLVVAILLLVFLQYVVHKTTFGKAMRAVSFDKDAARLMGINVDQVISFTFALGSSLAGAAGVLVGIAYPRIDPYMGIMPGLKAFVAAVLGGIGILPGAALGGLMMGVAEIMAINFLPSTFKDAVAFFILILVLLLKPTGLLGKGAGEKV